MLQLKTLVVRAPRSAPLFVCGLLCVLLCVQACGADPAGGGRRPGGTGGAGEAGGGPSGQGGLSGASGVGGLVAGASGGAATSGASGGAGTGATGEGLTVHIEDDAQLAIEIVTVSCPGECVEVRAVARGGQPAYHFEWEDGSTSETRTLCPEESSTHEVTVTDTGRDGEEFGREMQTAKASVDTRVLECPIEEPPVTTPDAGAGDECEDDSDCGAGQTCFEGICVGEGGLRFSLTWNVDTDFDLFVRMPDGRTEISYIFKNVGGGMLDVDDCFEGCRIPGGPHVENIFFEGEPPRGTYTYWVVNSGLAEGDDFRLEVSAAGTVEAMQTGNLPAFDAESDRYTFVY